MKTPCYQCKKRTAICHISCKEYADSVKKHREEKEIEKSNSDSLFDVEKYEIDRAFKIKRYLRNRRRK